MTITSIKISEETWAKLNQIKKLGESFDDILIRLLNELDECKQRLKELED